MFLRVILAAVAALLFTTIAHTTEKGKGAVHPAYCQTYGVCTDENILQAGVMLPRKPEATHVDRGLPQAFAAYCQGSREPVCVGGTPVNDDLWQRMLQNYEFMTEILTSDSTEEGETMVPVHDVLVLRTEEGVEYWDSCAVSRKNLLLAYWNLPEDKLALATARAADQTTSVVLLVEVLPFLSYVLDCENERVLRYDDFIAEANTVTAKESRIDGFWESEIRHTPEQISSN